MAGLSLRASGGVRAALPPSQAGTTIGQMAFGVGSGVDDSLGPATAGYGGICAAAIGGALLAFVWWSLPR